VTAKEISWGGGIGMEDITTVSQAINLFNWMDKDRFARVGEEPATLRDNGPREPFSLNGDPRYLYSITDVATLCELGFLRCDRGGPKLTEKADRLVEALRAREAERADLNGPDLDWIVVAHHGVFIDEGASPPNLRALMGEEWQPGDRIVITCHDPQYLLVSHLPLALAGGDPLFETDLREVAADFK